MTRMLWILVCAVAGCASVPKGAGVETPRSPESRPGRVPEPNRSAEGRPSGGPLVRGLERSTEILDAALASTPVTLRAEALSALGASGRPDALVKLTCALEAREGELRFAAARGLWFLHDARAAKAIEKALGSEKGWSVKVELARAAGACRDPTLAPALRAALVDPRPEVVTAAAFALQDLGDPSGPAALSVLGNPERKGSPKAGSDRWSRQVLAGEREGDPVLAAKTLAQIGTEGDVALLAQKLESGDQVLRLWAAAAIVRLEKAAAP